MGEHLKEPAQQAATAVKDAASGAVENVKAEAAAAKDEVADQVQQSRENLSGS